MEGDVWQAAADDVIIVRYLLGQLPEAERDHFEDRYFSDEALHEQLQAIEEELIDAYVDGDLTGEDLACFELRFIGSPERERKILFARALRAGTDRRARFGRLQSISEARHSQDAPGEFESLAAPVGGPPVAGGKLDSPPPSAKHKRKSLLSILIPRSFGMQMAFGGVAAALIAGWITLSFLWRRGVEPPAIVARIEQPVGYKSSKNPVPNAPGVSPSKSVAKSSPSGRPRTSSTGGHTDSTELDRETLSIPIIPLTPPSVDSAPIPSTLNRDPFGRQVLAFVLLPGTRGDGDGNIIALPSRRSFVRLELGLEASDYDQYTAVVETVDGNEVWKESNLTAQSSIGSTRTIRVQLRSDRLDPGDYLVKLSGLAPDGKTEVVAGYSFRVRRD